MRVTKKQINQLLSDKDEDALVRAYDGHLKKYNSLLLGRLPDFSEDTRLFVEMIADLDIVALLAVYDSLTEDLGEKLNNILRTAIKGAKDADNLNARFRSGLASWLRQLVGESY